MSETIYEKTLYQRPEGIDTISVMIYKEFVNSCMWDEVKSKRLSPYVSITRNGNFYRDFFYFHIQAEYLRMDDNILQQVLWAVYNELYCKGFMNPYKFSNGETALNLIFKAYHSLMCLTELDFNFDFRENVVVFNPKGVKCYDGTFYSKQPRSGHSKDTLYDRRGRLIAKNQINYDNIFNMERPDRFEIRMTKENCHFMNLDNLNGTYDFIIHNNWYSPIARAIGKFFPEKNICNEELCKDNPYFCELQTLFVQSPRKRNSETLLRTPKREKDYKTQ